MRSYLFMSLNKSVQKLNKCDVYVPLSYRTALPFKLTYGNDPVAVPIVIRSFELTFKDLLYRITTLFR